MHKYIRLFGISAILLMLFSTICGCNMNNNDADTTCIRIISTSDLHGKMLAYDYLLDRPDASGSLAQVSSAIAEYRNENTILVDGGDTIQDNFADIFNEEGIHPMVQGINAMLLEDTPMMSFVQQVMLFYTGADVAICAPCSNDSNVQEGDISVADTSHMYKYTNYISSVKMNGTQLKKYPEWVASFYRQYEDGDLIIAFEDTPVYMCDSATGVNYDIDISEPVGNRIKNLSYPDGRIVNDTDELIVVADDYRYDTAISIPGVIYEENEIPELVERDIGSDVGDIRSMLVKYIKGPMQGTIDNRCDNNWRIVGTNWDPELHKQAVALINDGTLKLTEGKKYNPCIEKITINDLANHHSDGNVQ